MFNPGQMAIHAANAKADSMLAPLLSKDDYDDDISMHEEDTVASDSQYAAKQSVMEKLKTALVYFVLIIGAGASVSAFVSAPHALVFVAGGLCVAHSPYSAYKEHMMSKIKNLRSMNNKMRELAVRLEGEVDMLSNQIDHLEPEVRRGLAIEKELNIVAQGQRVNVDHLVDLVKQNQSILDQMRDNLRQRIVQDIIKIVLKCDKKNTGRLDKDEAQLLALRIRIQLQEYGVEFDEHKFLHVLSSKPTVPRVIGIVQKLIPKYERKKLDRERSNKFTEKVGVKVDDDDDDDDESDNEDYDMFFMSSNIESLSGSLVGLKSSCVFVEDDLISLNATSTPPGKRSCRKSLLLR
mmetsp:Transcript_18865/g.39117  ORF Transcript_18865/g.39117 Transcript_18865/m.39117 type:complete len:350 (+) Transcript_18865:211-1260(+)